MTKERDFVVWNWKVLTEKDFTTLFGTKPKSEVGAYRLSFLHLNVGLASRKSNKQQVIQQLKKGEEYKTESVWMIFCGNTFRIENFKRNFQNNLSKKDEPIETYVTK